MTPATSVVLRHASGPLGHSAQFTHARGEAVAKECLVESAASRRYLATGLPRTDLPHYLWIQLFHPALKASADQAKGGRAKFVVAYAAAERHILAAASYRVAFAPAPML